MYDPNKDEMVECVYNGAITRVPRDLFAMVTLGIPINKQKFVRYKDGAKMYGMSQRAFYDLVHDADATFKRNGIALVNLEILDNFLEYFRE